MSVATMVSSINWDVVAEQKRHLVGILATEAACGGTVVFYPGDTDALHEILNLLTALQYAAADEANAAS